MSTAPTSLAQPNEQLPVGAVQQPNADSKDAERCEPPRLEDQKPTPRKRPGFVTRLQTHLNEDVSTSHADILMLTCCLVSGLVDSTIYNAYGTFVSMQTGTSRLPPVSPSFVHALTFVYTSLTRTLQRRKHHIPRPRRCHIASPSSESQTLRLGQIPHLAFLLLSRLLVLLSLLTPLWSRPARYSHFLLPPPINPGIHFRRNRSSRGGGWGLGYHNERNPMEIRDPNRVTLVSVSRTDHRKQSSESKRDSKRGANEYVM